MNLLSVAILIFSLSHAYLRGHRKRVHSQNKTNEGPPPKCSKSSREKFPDFSNMPLRRIDPEIVSAYRKWSVSNKSPVLDPTKTCKSEPAGRMGGRQFGLSKSNEIIHVFEIGMRHYCFPTGKDCANPLMDGTCVTSSDNLITMNQTGEIIDDDILGYTVYNSKTLRLSKHTNWDAYDDISCLC